VLWQASYDAFAVWQQAIVDSQQTGAIEQV
jgi:hypothetical protein